ncbi:hypothetical protein SKAU_G00417280 [Synaphobranchus kaupii]|uniref:C2H2-type domain-containing protein n=1 Tax=Synaphobranchus kaupii TaxID=118154 RepID=A0A9Q1E5W7_SYNKA|nr:hypothetical protein SKAU_G00417280 [Synaphobranchus kaupii]
MLGLQNTRTGGDLSTRTYRCVACAATFTGLSALLVHQASHANDSNPLNKLQPPPSSPGVSCNHCSIVFDSKELLNQHRCGAFPIPSPSFICECGEPFQNHGALLDHKRLHSHGSDLQVQNCSLEENKLETNGTLSSPPDQTNPSSSQGFNPVSGSDSGPSDLQLIPLLTGPVTAPENERREDSSLQLIPVSVSQPVVFSALPAITAPQDQPSPFGGNVMGPFLPSNVPTSSSSLPLLPLFQPRGLQQPTKTLKKMLFSEFMKRLPPAQISWNHSKGNISPRTAVSPVAGVDASPASSPGASVRRLRTMLAKSAAKRKAVSQASAILNLISSSKPHVKTASCVVNLTRTFLPVVALVTRQKLLGSGKEGVEGRHQCGRCRRIFQDVDSLIQHHAVHRKERINGCHSCGRLLIGRLAVPENHLCPQNSVQSPQDIFSVGDLLSSPLSTQAHSSQQGSVMANPLQITTPIPSAKKNYHCFLCDNNYTRLYGLKHHKCHGVTTILAAAASNKKDGVHSTELGMRMDGEHEVAGDELSLMHKSVGVGTTVPHGIKLEAFDVGSATRMMSPQAKSQVGIRRGSPKTSFHLKTAEQTLSKMPLAQTEGRCAFPAQSVAPVLQGNLEEDQRECAVASGDAQMEKGKGKWTIPIDDSEIDQLIEAEGADEEEEGDGDVMQSLIENSNDSTQNQSSPQNQPFQGGRNGFTCSHCGRSYTRHFTLRQHQKNCHLGARPTMQQNMRKALKVSKPWGVKQSFDCLQCGRSFSYRDTLVLHQKNCQRRNSRGNGNGGQTGPKKRNSMQLGQGHLGSQARLFVLPPSAQVKGIKGPENKKQATGGDWGIMSLPSVLPRKVTCECGEGFTCPRLLFEHLQLHAQESYICPHCGENLSSWPVFEAHLRKHQRVVCQKCNQTFSHRGSLVRHQRENRCPGGGSSTTEKKHCCPRCKLELPNALGLKLHMQSTSCKPHKRIPCPVCTRTFGGVEGLQRHLMAHSHPNAFRCQLCQRSYPSLTSLKDHRRKVHRTEKKSSGQGRVGGVSV